MHGAAAGLLDADIYGPSVPILMGVKGEPKQIDVNGAHAHPLYEQLKAEAPGALGTKGIKWNFTKFLVNAQGEVVERYGSSTTPQQIDAAVAKLL